MGIKRLAVFAIAFGVILVCANEKSAAQDKQDKQDKTEYRYLLNPGDMMEVSVWKDEALQRQVLVLPDGKISFPLVGFVQTNGKSTEDIQKIITERLAEFISNPVVTVSVTAVAGNRIYIIGKVKNPGVFPMDRPLDVMQALSLSGGLNTFADDNDILILRRTAESQKVFKFDYSEVANGHDLETNILLQSGDIIVVP